MESVVPDAAGHRRSRATMPGYHPGRAPRNKGLRYPADPPTIEEIVAAMRAAGDGPDGARPRALLVILWRAGLRISEALDLAESDLDRSRGAVLVRRGKGGRRREVGSPLISSATLMQSRWRTRVSPWSSPASARTREPRYLDLPAGDRQLGDHRHRSFPASTGDLSHGWSHPPIDTQRAQRATSLTRVASQSCCKSLPGAVKATAWVPSSPARR
jgi:integrase